jgi:hypothetical protein
VIDNGPRESVYPTAIHYEQEALEQQHAHDIIALIREQKQLRDDHSKALEFLREIAAWTVLVSSHEKEAALIRRVRMWLHGVRE